MHKTKVAGLLSFFAIALLGVAVPKRAEALVNVGAEGGIVKRSADAPSNLDVGFGYGIHGELDLLPLLKFGPYYLHYELSSADPPLSGGADAVFNTLGLRARLVIPIPGSLKPYGYVGVGYSWANYKPLIGDRSGHFVEIPIGVGLAYQVIDIFQISLDAAYRPGVAFGGDAFDGAVAIKHPDSGWSLLLGAALDF